jgi:putative MATE family efflux protein
MKRVDGEEGLATKGAGTPAPRIEKYRDRILNGAILNTLLWLSWPIIVANLIQASYNFVDALWLGRLSKEDFAAPTAVWPPIFLFQSIGIGVAQAALAITSQYYGAGDYERTRHSIAQTLLLMAITSVLIGIAGFYSMPIILRYMNVPSEVYPKALSYSRIILAGMPIVFMAITYVTVANSFGDTRTPTILSTLSATVNMVLDPLLIFGYGDIIPSLGINGAAIATLTSQAIVGLTGIYLIALRGVYGFTIDKKSLGLEKAWLVRVARIGLPITFQMSSNALGFTIMNSLVSLFGTVALAAYGVAIRILDIIQSFTWGIQRATAIMIGQNIGAEKYERARRIAYTSTLFIVIVLALGATLIYAKRASIAHLIIKEISVVEEASRLLAVFVWSIPAFGVFFVINGVAQGSGHVKAITLISIMRLWLLRIGLSYILAIHYRLGADGIWVAMTVSNLIAGIVAYLWLLHGSWTRKVVE